MEFDFVIIGGGSAGSTMAARLSEDPSVTVCLIEAGGKGTSILLRAPVGAVAALPGYGKLFNWAFKTDRLISKNAVPLSRSGFKSALHRFV